MRYASRWLALVLLALTAVGCAEPTAPTLAVTPRHDMACDPTSMFYDACSPSGGGGSALTTAVYPTGPGIPVITVTVPDAYARSMSYSADTLSSLFSPYPPCTVGTSTVPASNIDADPAVNTPSYTVTDRSVQCSDGPCYAALLVERNQFAGMVFAGTVAAGSLIVLTPAGATVRVIIGTAMMTGGGIGIGWVEYQRWQTARDSTNACVARNSTNGFYRQIVIH